MKTVYTRYIYIFRYNMENKHGIKDVSCLY